MGNFNPTVEPIFIYVAQANAKSVLDDKASPGDICDSDGPRKMGKLSLLDATWAMKYSIQDDEGKAKTICRSSNANNGPDPDVEKPCCETCGKIKANGRLEPTCTMAAWDGKIKPKCIQQLVLDLYDHDAGESVKLVLKGVALAKDLKGGGLSRANYCFKNNPEHPELFTFEIESIKKKHNYGVTFVPVFSAPESVDPDSDIGITLSNARAEINGEEMPF